MLVKVKLINVRCYKCVWRLMCLCDVMCIFMWQPVIQDKISHGKNKWILNLEHFYSQGRPEPTETGVRVLVVQTYGSRRAGSDSDELPWKQLFNECVLEKDARWQTVNKPTVWISHYYLVIKSCQTGNLCKKIQKDTKVKYKPGKTDNLTCFLLLIHDNTFFSSCSLMV